MIDINPRIEVEVVEDDSYHPPEFLGMSFISTRVAGMEVFLLLDAPDEGLPTTDEVTRAFASARSRHRWLGGIDFRNFSDHPLISGPLVLYNPRQPAECLVQVSDHRAWGSFEEAAMGVCNGSWDLLVYAASPPDWEADVLWRCGAVHVASASRSRLGAFPEYRPVPLQLLDILEEEE
jgi:hypothetical protein